MTAPTTAAANATNVFAPKLAAPLPLLPEGAAEMAELELAALEEPEVEEGLTVTPNPLEEEAGAVVDEPEAALEAVFETVSVAVAELEATDVEDVVPVVAGLGAM
jgi:hypothetical protein